MLHPVVFHNGRSVQFIAAWLLANVLPESPVELVELKELVNSPDGYLDGRTVYFVGDAPTPQQLTKYCQLTEHTVLIGYDTYGARGKIHPILKRVTHGSVYPATNRDILKGVLSYLRSTNQITDQWPIPALVAELIRDDNELRASYIYRTLACEKLTVDAVAELMSYTDQNIELLIAPGKALMARHRDFIRRTLENDVRPLDLESMVVLGCGTSHIYASCLAEELALRNIVGVAYYDTAQYRHYEIRLQAVDEHTNLATHTATMQSLIALKLKHSGVGTNHTMRFRVPRTHKLATI